MKDVGPFRRKSYLCLGFLVLWIIGLGTACNESSGLLPTASDFRFGAILVRAFDQRNSPVVGATMELRDNRGTLLWGEFNKTGVDGSVSFSPLTPGSHTIFIKPPAGFSVPASQANPVAVEVRNNQSSTVDVFLVAG